MYRTGDYVYVDAGPVSPFGVRRIDELQKSASGNVEMEVVNWKPFVHNSINLLQFSGDDIHEKN